MNGRVGRARTMMKSELVAGLKTQKSNLHYAIYDCDQTIPTLIHRTNAAGQPLVPWTASNSSMVVTALPRYSLEHRLEV